MYLPSDFVKGISVFYHVKSLRLAWTSLIKASDTANIIVQYKLEIQ